MNDNEQAQKSALANLSFVKQYNQYLSKRDNEAVESLKKQKEKFTQKQMRYIESMYEKIMCIS